MNKKMIVLLGLMPALLLQLPVGKLKQLLKLLKLKKL
jgi:hypothetical protein